MGQIKRTYSWFVTTVCRGVLGYLGFYLGIFLGFPLLAFINSLLPQWAWNGMFFATVMASFIDFLRLLSEEEPIPSYSLCDASMVLAGPPMPSLGARVRRGRPGPRAMFLRSANPVSHRCVRFGRTRLR